jgi:hypothetical protein
MKIGTITTEITAAGPQGTSGVTYKVTEGRAESFDETNKPARRLLAK